MVMFVFLMFVAMFTVAGFFISLEAKRRSDSQAERPATTTNHAPKIARAGSGGERAEDSRARAA